MRSLLDSSTSILPRFAALTMLVFALLLTGCESTSRSTSRSTSTTPTTSQAASSSSSARLLARDGQPQTLNASYVPRHARSTSFTDSGTRPSLATAARSVYGSADLTPSRSSSSASLTIFTSRSLRTIPIATYASSSRTGSSQTDRYSLIRRRPPTTTFARQPATSLRASRTTRSVRSSTPRSLEYEIGLTSARCRRQRSSTPGSWRQSTTERPSFVSRSTASLFASVWPRTRSSGSTSLNRSNLPRSSTVPT